MDDNSNNIPAGVDTSSSSPPTLELHQVLRRSEDYLVHGFRDSKAVREGRGCLQRNRLTVEDAVERMDDFLAGGQVNEKADIKAKRECIRAVEKLADASKLVNERLIALEDTANEIKIKEILGERVKYTPVDGKSIGGIEKKCVKRENRRGSTYVTRTPGEYRAWLRKKLRPMANEEILAKLKDSNRKNVKRRRTAVVDEGTAQTAELSASGTDQEERNSPTGHDEMNVQGQIAAASSGGTSGHGESDSDEMPPDGGSVASTIDEILAGYPILTGMNAPVAHGANQDTLLLPWQDGVIGEGAQSRNDNDSVRSSFSTPSISLQTEVPFGNEESGSSHVKEARKRQREQEGLSQLHDSENWSGSLGSAELSRSMFDTESGSYHDEYGSEREGEDGRSPHGVPAGPVAESRIPASQHDAPLAPAMTGNTGDLGFSTSSMLPSLARTFAVKVVVGTLSVGAALQTKRVLQQTTVPTTAVFMNATVAPTTPFPDIFGTGSPSRDRTLEPSPFPTTPPTLFPTAGPTTSPTLEPSPFPTTPLTPFPTSGPTKSPTALPTLIPTPSPTVEPSESPSAQPSSSPTKHPCFQSSSELFTARDNWFDSTGLKASVEAQYGPIRDWCFGGGLTNMAELFAYRSDFNEDISSWDVSSVTDMSVMFFRASSFNHDLSSWNVSSVQTMAGMFSGASSFNKDLSSWDVSAVKTMKAMFVDASSFNQDLSSWDVSSVTNMRYMFRFASSFNQDISSWDVAAATDMEEMFREALAFNQDLSSWDVSAVTTINGMFWLASSFNRDLCAWGSRLPSNVYVGAVSSGPFWLSDCPFAKGWPNLSGNPRGPFCHSC